MEKLKKILSQVFTPGTPVSVIAWGLVGVVVARYAFFALGMGA